MRIVPERLTPMVIEYGAGWHPPESDPRVPDPERRSWRWTEKQAKCRIAADGGEGLLVLYLGVNLERCSGQQVTLTLDGRALDRFEPMQATCRREYVVDPGFIAASGELSLEIVADQTFVPADADPANNDRRELGVQVFDLSYARRG
jgi:hypothetical protein